MGVFWKVRRVKQGDFVATPVGFPNWFYSDGNNDLIMVTLIDTSNNENQLANNRRTFYLGGNPQQQQQTQQGRWHPFQPSRGTGQEKQESSSGNIFSGLDKHMLAEIFGINRETARKLSGLDDQRGDIVQVENELHVIRLPTQNSNRNKGKKKNKGNKNHGKTKMNHKVKENKRRYQVDLFHPCAEFHAASRAISGGPVYVSDKVGDHDFDLLKEVTLPDASTLRYEYHALPTRDCLFEDPAHDAKTMLKIWNLNKYTGVIGAFNCQGGGWSREERKNRSFPECSRIVTCKVNPNDVEWKNGPNPILIDDVESFAMYAFKANKFELLKASESIELSLKPFSFEILRISPVKMSFYKKIQFAPIGLTNMLNTGGAMQLVCFDDTRNLVQIVVRGAGKMKVFASEKPKRCGVNSKDVLFVYDDSLVVVDVPWPNC